MIYKKNIFLGEKQKRRWEKRAGKEKLYFLQFFYCKDYNKVVKTEIFKKFRTFPFW